MDLNRQSQRRRKLAIDQRQQSPQAQASRPQTGDCSGAKIYEQAAKRSRQRKTTDLLPKRPWMLAIVIGVLILVTALLNGLHANAAQWETLLKDPSLQVLQMNGPDSLANWYASLLLLLTSGASLQIYLLRRHRRDDYRGAYRIWLWMAGLFVLASMLCTSGMYRLIEFGFEQLAANRVAMSAVTLLLIIKLAGLVLLTARAVYEVRHSKAAVVALAVVFIAIASAAMMDNPKIHTMFSGNLQAAHSNLMLVGISAAFASVLFYARLVYLQAHGLAIVDVQRNAKHSPSSKKEKSVDKSTPKTSRPKSKKKPSDVKSKSGDQTPTETGSDKASKATRSKKRTQTAAADNTNTETSKKTKGTQPQQQEPVQTTHDSDQESNSQGLSKSERRRLRKLQRRQKRAA